MMTLINKVTSMLQGKSEKEGSCGTEKKPDGEKSGGCCGGHCH